MPKLKETQSLDTEVTKDRQRTRYREYLQCVLSTQVDYTVKLRITIETDSVSYQSTCEVSMWSPPAHQWQPLADIHYSHMKTPFDLAYRGDFTAKDFKQDRDELVRKALLILT